MVFSFFEFFGGFLYVFCTVCGIYVCFFSFSVLFWCVGVLFYWVSWCIMVFCGFRFLLFCVLLYFVFCFSCFFVKLIIYIYIYPDGFTEDCRSK